MAKKGSAGGTQLASGYISLSVKYAGAMGQIASDFDAIEKRSKAAGESLTKNLVSGADSAKAKVAELGSAYEAQRAKVSALKETLNQLQAQQSKAAAAQAAYTAALNSDKEKRKAYIQEEIRLNEELNRVRSQARSSGVAKEEIESSAAVKAVQQQISANDAQRKADLQTLTRLEKELAAARSAASTDGSKVQEALNAELAKGKDMFEQYGKAVEDAARRQQLAATSSAALTNSMGSVTQHMSFGQRMARLIAGPFAPELQAAGTKAGNAFRRAFSHQMDGAKQESEHHARSLANGLLMGMTPGVMGAAGVGLAIGKAFSMGFERNEVIETTKLRLQALGKTSQEISAVTDTALKSVQGTQYSLAEAIDAASGAMLSGIKLGPEMTQYMDNIANAAALTGVEYATVADAMGRVQRQGTVSLENIEPLTNKGLPVLDWLKEYYTKDFPNTTKADITEMISKKLIPADVLQKVMSAHLNNSMKDIGKKTVKGAFTDLMTQVGKVTGSILQPVMGEGGIPAFLNKIGAKLSTFSEYIKPGMASFVGWVRRQWAVVSDVFGAVIAWVKERWAAMWPTMKVWIDKFTAMWREMWPQLIAHVQPLLAAFRRLWDALWPIVKPLVGLAGLIAYEFIKHMPAIAQFATNLVNWLATAMDWLRTKFWPWLKDSWIHFKNDVTDAWNTVKTFSDKVIGFFDAIKTGTQKTWTWIEDKFKWLKDNVPGISTLLSALGFTGPDNVALMSSSSPLVNGAVSGAPGSYGLPAGSNSGGYGGGGVQFPQWVYDFGKAFNIKPSTYPGHQERNGVNHGIDWTGSPEDLQRAADFLASNGGADQVIYANPNTGQKTGYATGYGRVGPGTATPGYYRDDWADHGDHMHTSFSRSLTLSASSVSLTSGGMNPLWDKIAAAESSRRWNDNNSGNNSTSSGAPRGGLQITDGTWKAFGGTEFAPNAAMASQAEQIEVAKRIAFTGWKGTPPQGLSAWETITQGKVPGVTANMSADDFGGIQNLSTSSPLIDFNTIANGGVAPTNPLWAPLSALPPEQIATTLTTPPASAAGPPGIPWAPGGSTFPSTGGNPIDIFQGSTNPVSIAPGGLANGAVAPPGPVSQSFWDKYIKNDPLMPQWMKEIFKPRTVKVLDNTEMPGASLFDAGANFLGMPVSPLQPNDSGAGRTAANQYEHRGIKPPDGPKGTKDDPIVTTDPKVAENTDPDNQPGMPGGPALPPDAGGGLGKSANASIAFGTDANGNPVGPDGKPLGDLATGLGDVASKAFSDQFAGTPFSDPTQWPMTQSAGALLQFFGGLLRGQGGSGLGGLFGPGGKRPTSRQTREAGERVSDAQAKVDDLKKKMDDMVGKPQYTDQDRADAKDAWEKATRELGDAKADQNDLLGSTQGPFGMFNLGTPPPAPGGDINGGAIAPGGGWAGASLPTGLIPSPSDVQPAAPAAGGPQVIVDNSIKQEITGDPAQARDQAERATNTQNAAANNTIKYIPGQR